MKMLVRGEGLCLGASVKASNLLDGGATRERLEWAVLPNKLAHSGDFKDSTSLQPAHLQNQATSNLSRITR
jgi:hypothetical protein